MKKEQGFSNAELFTLMGFALAFGFLMIFAWNQGTQERNQYIKMGNVVKLENGDVQVTVTNKGTNLAKNIRLTCQGKTAAGDSMDGDIIFYDAVQPNETKTMASKEMIQQKFEYSQNISLSNIKTIQCTLNSVDMDLSKR